MRWGKSIGVTSGTSRSDPVVELVKLKVGLIERITVYFRPGAHGYVHVSFYHREHQFLPDNPNETIQGDDLLFDMAMDYEIEKQPAHIEIVAWNEDTKHDHALDIQIFVREGLGDRVKDALRALFGLG